MKFKSLNVLLVILLVVSIAVVLPAIDAVAKPVEPNPGGPWPSGTIWGTRLRLENGSYVGTAWFGAKTGAVVQAPAPTPPGDFMRPVFLGGTFAKAMMWVDNNLTTPQSYSWYVLLERGGVAPSNGTVSCEFENATHVFVPPDFSVVLENSAQGIFVNLREENGYITGLPKYATLHVDNHVNLTIENLDPLAGDNGDTLRLNVTVYNTGRYSDNFAVSYHVGGSIDPWVDNLELGPGENDNVIITTSIPAGTENIIVWADGWYADDNDYVTASGAAPPDVEVTISPAENEAKGCTTLAYTVTVTNTGAENDNFDLTVSDNLGWCSTDNLDDNRFENVPPGDNRTTTLRVHIPTDVPDGTEDDITVTATSQRDNTVSGENSCIARAVVRVDLYDESYVFVGGFDNIQPAIDNALPNYTVIVHPGTYVENLNVDKENLMIRSANGAAVTIVQTPNLNDHVFEVTADGVSIIGFTILDATNRAGVYLDYVDDCHIENNTFENSYYGIYLYYSNYNTVLYNTISWHDYGFYVWYSDNNQIGNNDILHTSQYNFGSCPFLYTWNGIEMELFGDINGPGGLGYRMDMSISGGGIKELRPPTSIDYTAIDSSVLVPKDGNYILEIAEEQDEIAYFDEAELWVIDHDPGVEIYSPEASLCTQTPYLYPPVIHTVRNPVPPVCATDWNGNDILPVIASPDEVYTEAELLTDSFITLDLGNLSGASQIKLIYRAYTDWSPIGKVKANQYVEVKNALGEWELVSENEHFGKPEALPRTWVIDITDWFKTDDWHLRLHTGTCKIHVDWIAIDTSVDEPVNVTVLQPTSANHYYKGPDKLGFEYFFGNFTKYGDVLPLVENADDKFVIMRVGDSIELKFAEQPAPVGERDFWFVTDSYFKQPFVKYLLGSDISIVDPLPFHGMSNYPYPPSESYPSDAEHLAYLSEWNTREYVEGKGAGISLPYSENNVVFGNTIIGDPSSMGLVLEGENNTRILNNTISNTGEGLSIYYSSGIFVSGNQISNNQNEGIYLENSDNNFLYNNTCENNQYGIYLDYSDNNILYYDNCDNNDFGIYLYYSENNFIYNCIVENNEYHGILLNNSNNNGIYNCTARNNDESGITLDKPSDNNYVFGCTVSNNNNYGIWLDSSDNCSIGYNTIDNNGHGIYITGTVSFAWISFNNITNNTGIPPSGIHIDTGVDSTGIWVNYNNIVGNSPSGVYNGGTGELNARYNWWGDASGPGEEGPGTGDNVGENVDYRPWLPGLFEDVVLGMGYEYILEGHNENVNPVLENLDWAPIPENVVVTLDSSENGWLSITVLENLGGAPIPENLVAAKFIDISTFPENIAENIWITIHYTDEDVAMIEEEENLKLYYWRENENWQLCDNIVVDTANNTITGQISHLTPFGMFGPPRALGVDVSISPFNQANFPGSMLEYTVTVNNIGLLPDNYTLEYNIYINTWWPVALDNTVLEVPGFGDRTTTLQVTIPENAIYGDKARVTVTATSQTDNTVNDMETCWAQAAQLGVEVLISPNRLDSKQGETLPFEVQVINTSSADYTIATPDNYTLEVSDTMGWTLELGDNRLENVSAGENRTTTLQVTIPNDASYCTEDNITVTATSEIDNTVSAEDSCFSHVKFKPIVPNPGGSFPSGTIWGTKLVLENGIYTGDAWFGAKTGAEVKAPAPPPPTDYMAPVFIGTEYLMWVKQEVAAPQSYSWYVKLDRGGAAPTNGAVSCELENVTHAFIPPDFSVVLENLDENIFINFRVENGYITGLPKYATLYVDNITPEFEVSVSPSYAKGSKGDNFEFTITVVNQSTDWGDLVPEAFYYFDLTVSDDAGWCSTDNLDNSVLEVPAGESRQTTLSVKVPDNVVLPTKDNIIITATSWTDPWVSDSASLTVYATILGSIEVSISPSTQSGMLGSTLSYTVEVTSSCNVEDNFDLKVSVGGGWSSQVSPSVLKLAPGASGTATLSVMIPSGAGEGVSQIVTVTVTSEIDPSAVSDSAKCTATAKVSPIAPPGPEEEEEVPPPSPRLPAEERGPLLLIGVAIFVAFLVIIIALYMGKK